MEPQNREMQEVFKAYKDFYIQMCESYQKEANNDQINKALNKPKAIWKKINELTGRIALNHNQDRPSSQDLGDYFISSVRSLQENLPNISSCDSMRTLCAPMGSTFFFEPTDKKEISRIISRIKSKKTKDHFDLDTETLKFMEPAITEVLAEIINQCISSGVYPNKMKIGKITPVFKKGCRGDPANYRPISVLPAFSKVFEAIITSRIANFFDKCKYLNDQQ